ncbi:MAG TPA: DUF5658 family protein [Chloroflexota bacterium]
MSSRPIRNAAQVAPTLIAFVAINLFDAASTWIGLVHGLRESNPVPSLLLYSGGLGAMFGFKLLAMGLAVGIVLYFGARVPGVVRSLRLMNWVVGAVVVANVAQLVLL